MNIDDVKLSYQRWAPVYDSTFGLISKTGRKSAVSYINKRSGKLLEVGVGTGLALGSYAPHLEVTGVDFSEEMLAKARRKVETQGLRHVAALRRMDARALDFPDDHFDTVVAMFVVSVAPDPEAVVSEMARVCKPGGAVLIVNHFARERGAMAAVERAFAPFAHVLGWRPDFQMARVLGSDRLELLDRSSFPPFGMFTFLKLRKTH